MDTTEYIYVLYDQLYEKVVCTHPAANMTCELCRDKFASAPLIQVMHTVETNKKVLDDWDSLNYRMYEEGFNYCFDSYSDWDEIKDFEFHRLRVNYLEAAKKLNEYVKTKHKANEYGKR